MVFASAGLIDATGGPLLCALDGGIGMPILEKRFADESETSLSATGQMAWYGGRLWLHVGDSGVLIVDPGTGQTMPAIDSDALDNRKATSSSHMRQATWGATRGQDIGIPPAAGSPWVANGSICRQGYVGQPRSTSTVLRAEPETVPVDGNGYPNVLVLTETHGSDAIPVGDANDTLLSGSRNQARAVDLAVPVGVVLEVRGRRHQPIEALPHVADEDAASAPFRRRLDREGAVLAQTHIKPERRRGGAADLAVRERRPKAGRARRDRQRRPTKYQLGLRGPPAHAALALALEELYTA